MKSYGIIMREMSLEEGFLTQFVVMEVKSMNVSCVALGQVENQ